MKTPLYSRDTGRNTIEIFLKFNIEQQKLKMLAEALKNEMRK